MDESIRKTMIFGYYHIPMITADKEDVSALGFPPNASVKLKVKVGHMVFIPFIPLDKYWVLDANGQSYQLNKDAKNYFENKYGKRGYPWYSFFGFLAIGAFILFSLTLGPWLDKRSRNRYKKQRTEQFTKKIEKRDKAVDNPKETDYYHFKDTKYREVVFKVDHSTADSTYFEAPVTNPGKWSKKNYAVGFYRGDAETKILGYSKKELKESYARDTKTRIPMMYLNHASDQTYVDLTLDKIVHFEESAKGNTRIPIVNEKMSGEVKKAAQHFVQHMLNADSLDKYMDRYSKNYFKELLSTAYKTDSEAYAFTNNSEYSKNGAFEYMLYTRFVFLDSYDSEGKNEESEEEKLKSLIFFLRLLDRSFLTIESPEKRKFRVGNIELFDGGKATVTFSASSNMLTRSTSVSFPVEMNKEEGLWKVNVPSSYMYTKRQLLPPYNSGFVTESQFRQMLLKNLKDEMGVVGLSEKWR